MRVRGLALAVALLVPTALAGQGRTGPVWTGVASPEGAFTIQGPGAATSDPARPGHYAFAIGESSFLVDASPLTDVIQRALTGSDRALVKKYLEAARDGAIKAMKGARRTSSTADVDGHPSIAFSFDGEADHRAFEAHELIALADERMYILVAIGPKGELKAADANRFLKSFHVVSAAPMAGGAFRTVAFTDAVCARIPPVPVTFQIPADFLLRAVGQSSDAGCLWGTRQDLDRVTADPTRGDFTMLRRGVFRARVSTSVVFSAQSGEFDPLDGTGELGIRRQLESVGGRVLVWKRQALAGLPGLEIVAEVAGGRVFMLYLGETRYLSNALLVNYYPATKTSAEDDRIWVRFVAGIKKAAGTASTGNQP